MKRVLVVHFSQTGQLSEAVAAVVRPLREAGHQVREEVLLPEKPFSFPWSLRKFLDVFPESVQLAPAPIRPLCLPAEAEFDLIVLAYQAWFLSPSQPMTAFLKSADAARLLRGKPVVTLVACRNMWLMAQEKMKSLIAGAGGELRDHIALTDPPENALSTFITTPRWLLTGRRTPFWGLPAAGIPSAQLRGAERFGRALAVALDRNAEREPQPMLAGLRAAPVDLRLIMSERAGHRAFMVWSRLIRRLGTPGSVWRLPALLLFAIYLILMILTVVPLSRLLQMALAPLLRPALLRQQAYYEAPSGAGDFNLHRYEH